MLNGLPLSQRPVGAEPDADATVVTSIAERDPESILPTCQPADLDGAPSRSEGLFKPERAAQLTDQTAGALRLIRRYGDIAFSSHSGPSYESRPMPYHTGPRQRRQGPRSSIPHPPPHAPVLTRLPRAETPSQRRGSQHLPLRRCERASSEAIWWGGCPRGRSCSF